MANVLHIYMGIHVSVPCVHAYVDRLSICYQHYNVLSGLPLVSCPDPPLAIKKRGNEKRAADGVGSGDETSLPPIQDFLIS